MRNKTLKTTLVLFGILTVPVNAAHGGERLQDIIGRCKELQQQCRGTLDEIRATQMRIEARLSGNKQKYYDEQIRNLQDRIERLIGGRVVSAQPPVGNPQDIIRRCEELQQQCRESHDKTRAAQIRIEACLSGNPQKYYDESVGKLRDRIFSVVYTFASGSPEFKALFHYKSSKNFLPDTKVEIQRAVLWQIVAISKGNRKGEDNAKMQRHKEPLNRMTAERNRLAGELAKMNARRDELVQNLAGLEQQHRELDSQLVQSPSDAALAELTKAIEIQDATSSTNLRTTVEAHPDQWPLLTLKLQASPGVHINQILKNWGADLGEKKRRDGAIEAIQIQMMGQAKRITEQKRFIAEAEQALEAQRRLVDAQEAQIAEQMQMIEAAKRDLDIQYEDFCRRQDEWRVAELARLL